jgi:hypothetical protein
MWITLVIIAAILVGFLLLRLRVRFELDGLERRVLFLGLGRSGPELDFVRKTGVFRLFGISIRSFEFKRKKAKPKKKPTPVEKEAEEKPEARKKGRKRSIKDILSVVPSVSVSLWKFFVGLIRSAIIEEARGTIQGGFEEPDLTGQAFGYYQAMLGAVPALACHIVYHPDWTGASFTGSMRLAVAIPMYKLAWRTVVLLWGLPLRKLVKLAIGQKRGEQDVQ